MALGVIGTSAPAPLERGRRRHRAEVLRAAAHRVAVDLHMVETLGQKALVGDGLSPEVRCAVGEAFLLHVWSLREFFYGTRRGGVGILAGDYFARPAEWETVRPALPSCLGKDWHRLSSAVRHTPARSSG